MNTLALWLITYAAIGAAVYLYTRSAFDAVVFPLLAQLAAVVASRIAGLIEVLAL